MQTDNNEQMEGELPCEEEKKNAVAGGCRVCILSTYMHRQSVYLVSHCPQKIPY